MSTNAPEAPSAVPASQANMEKLVHEPFLNRVGTYIKMSGPGWLQSAITLGGGSLSGSLYLGVLAGFGLLWVQACAMILGVIMLSAISYVTLSTGRRPFEAINREINPVLGWSWAIATVMANMVWCMPQFNLALAAVQQNLFPSMMGDESLSQQLPILLVVFAICYGIVWSYNSGGKGIATFELILKVIVAVDVVSFMGVVLKMSLMENGLDWGKIFEGFIPDLTLLTNPSVEYAAYLAETGSHAAFWTNKIVTDQQNIIITAAATAVGINMTFLMPYTLLKKGWNRNFREMAIFDLSFGLFLPFILATGCIVIAAAHQFHAKPVAGLYDPSAPPAASNLKGGYEKLLNERIKSEIGADAYQGMDAEQLSSARESLPLADKKMAAMLVTPDAFNLASALSPLTGKFVAQYVFGIGVLGMAVSTIIILMLINGFAFCEMAGQPDNVWLHRFGCLIAGLSGMTGPFLFKGEAKLWLAVPTSMFGMMLLPVAYLTFSLMFNSKNLMGENRPKGVKLVLWNLLMAVATGLAFFGAYWSIRNSAYPTQTYIAAAVVLALIAIGPMLRKKEEMLITGAK